MFEKFILKRAEKIQARKKAELDKRNAAWKITSDRKRAFIARITQILTDELDRIEKTMVPFHLFVKEGDRAILNIYRMLYASSMDGWDGGTYSLTSNVSKEDENVPVFVTIKKVIVNKSYSTEMITKFIDRNDTHLNNKTDLQIINMFRHFFNMHKPSCEDTLGMYYSATFDTEISFKPVWSLSLTCFLKEGTEAAKITEDIWREEISIKNKQIELQKRQKELATRQKEINAAHRGITIR